MFDMSKQEMFEKAVKGLREQKAFSMTQAGGYCVYRGPDGTKCAMGMLIPDELYSTEMEHTTAAGAYTMRLHAMDSEDSIDTETWRYLNRMQKELHDNLARGVWKDASFEMTDLKFADNEGLEYV